MSQSRGGSAATYKQVFADADDTFDLSAYDNTLTDPSEAYQHIRTLRTSHATKDSRESYYSQASSNRESTRSPTARRSDGAEKPIPAQESPSRRRISYEYRPRHRIRQSQSSVLATNSAENVQPMLETKSETNKRKSSARDSIASHNSSRTLFDSLALDGSKSADAYRDKNGDTNRKMRATDSPALSDAGGPSALDSTRDLLSPRNAALDDGGDEKTFSMLNKVSVARMQARRRQRRRYCLLCVAVTVVIGAAVGGTLGALLTKSHRSNSPDRAYAPAATVTPIVSKPVANPGTGGASGYAHLLAFGASYCDNAHLRTPNYTDLTSQPYWRGRWSNGPVWDEWLAALVGPQTGEITNATMDNRAYAGAMIDDRITSAWVPDTRSQIAGYLSDLAGGNTTTAATLTDGTKSLITVWTGLNPIEGIWNITGSSQRGQAQGLAQINATVEALTDQLLSIATLATWTVAPDFVILSPPPSELLPFAQNIAQYQAQSGSTAATRLAVLQTLSDAYNVQLQSAMITVSDALGSRGKVYTFDVHTWFHNMVATPAAYNLTVTNSSCLQQQCGTAASTYLFWDPRHPVATIHEALAKEVAGVILQG
ncbi:uncharacterized protein L969DRAFT_93276 [Mixia osmundae IAM 14324]|uniref:Carbohydrate esterase family 16 protein n=1 Tax=Mixia osmundae (strain CBS 9802 / IAM 14324 / JCM 22182 / KY 12970) TaxID=764103 RepID=G7E5K2_MIXOS|nr:uncharacterized protein L969DRAFT_93276 [Mixia osmundae IAM 14324]KEI40741.1 hypothetical protein L969DRAFT_93276 [Mixia osmundae IAM 14324]GAA98112.1 hypothetical protein E5Q_04795 [Mixia osmundae IAM 14324]